LQVKSEVHLKYVRGWPAKFFKILALVPSAYKNGSESSMIPITNEENFAYWRRLEEHSNPAFRTIQPHMLQEVVLSRKGFEELEEQSRYSQKNWRDVLKLHVDC